jgi:asparagine synthase (glutamine-hydrolysing)
VRLLPAGCVLRVRATDGGVGEPRRYWDFRFQESDRPLADAEYVEELDRLFRQAVSRQLVSDVEVGAYLSGGMDSGSITAVAARKLPSLRTFTPASTSPRPPAWSWDSTSARPRSG